MAGNFNFKVGTKVEVTSSDPKLRGTLFPGKISSRNVKAKNTLTVEYEFKIDRSTKQAIREEVCVSMVRPRPPKQKNYEFKIGDTVDVFSSGGWWQGEINEVFDNPIKFSVSFKFSERAVALDPSRLRLHREWMNGVWVPSIDDHEEAPPKNKPKTLRERIRKEITKDMEVEVSNDEEGFEGAWFAATVLKVLKDDKFLIKYQSLRTDDNKDFLKEKVDVNHIRPCPPKIVLVDGFNVGDEVEAFCNDGWWEGQVSKVRRDSRYRVYFEKTDDDGEFPLSELRQRQVWKDAAWVMASQL